jgi:hypothetical protein
LRTEFFSIEKWFFHQSVVFGSKRSDKNLMMMRRKKRGQNHASVYSGKKERRTSEKDPYDSKKERKDLHEMAGGRPIYLKDYNSLM